MDRPVPVASGDVDPASTPQSAASSTGTGQVRIAGLRGQQRILRCPPSRFRARLRVMEHHEVIVIGAGVSGIYQIKRLVDLGVDATVLEAGGDLGGTWYWNRYPGRPLRLGELHLRLLLLARAAGGVALEGALLRPAREPALPELRRRQVRPAPAHAVQLPGRVGALRRGAEPVAPAPRRRPRRSPAAS